ncbi:MAG: 3-hydroxyacyl-CoA dehydrogenase family protein [Myxococcales bacterium]|nr:3-hydroxyacyl-CoA dehydrogenase family protein [Myxococcales bacterium]
MTATTTTMKRVAVIGTGTMGRGIAQVAASAGATVYLYDQAPAALASAHAAITAALDKGVGLGKVTAEAREATLSRLHLESDLAAACQGADAVVEAIPEELALKQRVLAEVEGYVAPSTLLATNTSSLSIAAIAGPLARPERLLGMHFFNPVHIMKLVEVVTHAKVAAEAVARATAWASAMDKTAIVVTDSPGFASSRLGLVIGLEAMRMVEQGVASAGDIDTAMKLGYGHPMGPLELTDLVGLDVRLGIADYLTTTLGPAFTPPQVLRDLVAQGHLGKKSGRGFYRWVDGRRA